MHITDIVVRSHIVSEGKLTAKQLERIETLLSNNTSFEEIIKILKDEGHEIFHEHCNELAIGRFNSTEFNSEDSEGFLKALEERIKEFSSSIHHEPNQMV